MKALTLNRLAKNIGAFGLITATRQFSTTSNNKPTFPTELKKALKSPRLAPTLQIDQRDFAKKLAELKNGIINPDSGIVAFKIEDIATLSANADQQKLLSEIMETRLPSFSTPYSIESLSMIMPEAAKTFLDIVFKDSNFTPHKIFDEDSGDYIYASLITMRLKNLESGRGSLHTDFPDKPIVASFVCNILGSFPSGEAVTSLSIVPIADIMAQIDDETIEILTNPNNFIFNHNDRQKPMAPIGRENGYYLVNYFLEIDPNHTQRLVPQNEAAQAAYQKLNDVAVGLVRSDKAIKIDCNSQSIIAISNKFAIHCRDEGKTPSNSPDKNGDWFVRAAVTSQGVVKD